jgi:hypothetical protein
MLNSSLYWTLKLDVPLLQEGKTSSTTGFDCLDRWLIVTSQKGGILFPTNWHICVRLPLFQPALDAK